MKNKKPYTYIKDGMVVLLQKKTFKNDEESINLLTSLMLRFPELCKINYTPNGQLLKMNFILQGEIDYKLLTCFKERLENCVNVFMYYENKRMPKCINIEYAMNSGITVIQITRDTVTLTPKEITLIVDILHQQFENKIVSDGLYIDDEELLDHDDYIGNMLDNLRIRKPKNKFIALREEGRVLVFKR